MAVLPSRKYRILSVASHELLRSSRQLLLEQGGYKVVSAANLQQVEAACREIQFDLVLLGWSVAQENKLAAARLVQRLLPAAIILDWARGKTRIRGATHFQSHDTDQLLQYIGKLLRGNPVSSARVSSG